MKFCRIVRFHSMIVAFAVVGWTSVFAEKNENAQLRAEVQAGPLEVSLESAKFEYLVESGNTRSVDEVDAVLFTVAGLVVNDLNGDGMGWRLTASPEPLTSGAHLLPVGSVSEFVGFDRLDGISTNGQGQLVSSQSSGIANFVTDYSVSYTLPASTPAGNYRGAVSFSIVAD